MDNTHILTTLESAANQIFAVVAPHTVRLVRVGVVISDEAETACTDGRIVIWMPTRFHGVSVAQNLPIAIGLLAHEVSHFLQPLDAIEQVEESEHIPHWLSNVALDVQGESLVESIFPAFHRPLAQTRRAVQQDCEEVYRAGVAQAQDFVQAAGHLALWGRFHRPLLPFWSQEVPPGSPDQTAALRFLHHLDTFRTCPAGRLPQALTHLIHTFPELRSTPVPRFPDGMGQRPALPQDVLLAALQREALGHVGGSTLHGSEELRIHKQSPCAFLPDAQALSRGLRPHFTGRQAVTEVVAPGRFLRRAAVREVIPFRLRLPGHTHPATKLVLCLDASGSMGATCPGSNGSSKWHVAQLAAQALALAVQQSGGQVVGVVFGDHAWTTPDSDSLALAPERTAQVGRTGSGTSFRFLSDLWRRYPQHRVLVLTDGSGDAPSVVIPADRQRTSALIIPMGSPHQATPWSERQVVLKDLRHLGEVMAVLSPGARG